MLAPWTLLSGTDQTWNAQDTSHISAQGRTMACIFWTDSRYPGAHIKQTNQWVTFYDCSLYPQICTRWSFWIMLSGRQSWFVILFNQRNWTKCAYGWPIEWWSILATYNYGKGTWNVNSSTVIKKIKSSDDLLPFCLQNSVYPTIYRFKRKWLYIEWKRLVVHTIQ